jgi:hypothetical protein
MPPLNPIRIAKSLYWISWPVFLFLWAHPVSYRSTRLAIIVLALFIWTLTLLLWWKSKPIRYLCCGVFILVLLVAILPGRNPNPSHLRDRYVRSLLTYEGTKYVWGGENRLGIDCSGLIRRALIISMLQEGLTTGNPGLIRQSYAMRWFDCTANALKNGHRNQTRQLFASPSIHATDHSKLLPGDLAVTADGVHILAYIGNQTWIEADPGGAVKKLHATEDNDWLQIPIVLLRWEILNDPQ